MVLSSVPALHTVDVLCGFSIGHTKQIQIAGAWIAGAIDKLLEKVSC